MIGCPVAWGCAGACRLASFWVGESVEQGGDPMSISATKILLATDGSEEAMLAATTAAALAEGTDSELHVVTVGPFVPTVFAATEEEPHAKPAGHWTNR